jgi:hypothetical protein
MAKHWISKGDGLKIPHHTDPARKDWDKAYKNLLVNAFGNGDPTRLRPVTIPVLESNLGHYVREQEGYGGRNRVPLYTRMLAGGDRVPPIVVQKNGLGWRVVDGNARMTAALKNGVTHLKGYEMVDPSEKKLTPPTKPGKGRSMKKTEPKEHPIFAGGTFGLMSGEKPMKGATTVDGGHDALGHVLNQMGLHAEPTGGRYEEPERSYIIHNPTVDQMQRLGRMFGQESVIHSENGVHKLIYTNGEKTGKFVQNQPEEPITRFETAPEDFFTHVPGHGHFRINFNWNQLHDLAPVAKSEFDPSEPIEGEVVDLRTDYEKTVTKSDSTFKLNPRAYYHVTDRQSAHEIMQHGFFGGYGDVGYGAYFWNNPEYAHAWGGTGSYNNNLSDSVILEIKDHAPISAMHGFHPDWEDERDKYENMSYVPMDENNDEATWRPSSIKIYHDPKAQSTSPKARPKLPKSSIKPKQPPIKKPIR